MGHRLDFVPWIRKKLYPKLQSVALLIGGFATSHEPEKRYVGSIEASIDDVEHELHHLGFVRNIGSSVKYHDTEGGRVWTKGSWAKFHQGLFGDRQLHIGLYSAEDDGVVDVYAHEEPNWIRHPFQHMDADDVNSEKGVEMMRRILLDDSGFAVFTRSESKRRL